MNQMTQLLAVHGAPVLFAVVLVDQIGLPLPSAPWLLAAGAFSAHGMMNAVLALGTCIVACLTADSLWFYLGRRRARPMLRVFFPLSLVPTFCVGPTKRSIVRRRLQGLVVAKFLPGLGMVMPALVGALGVSVAQFLLYDSLGSFLYGAFYIAAGFLFQNQLREFLALVNQLGFSGWLLALVLVLAYLAFKYVRGRPVFITHHIPSERAGQDAIGQARL